MVTSVDTIGTQNSYMDQAVTAGHRVASAIRSASASVGADFSYLLNNANVESSLNPAAKSSTSSATGLYQFVEQTWLRVIKAYGDKHGLTEVADSITIGNDGVARVKTASERQAILNLRKDPEISSQMAAELTNENRETLETKVGGKIGATELYLAHFLGANGAATFIKTMRQNPQAVAADVLPTAAAANSKVFYDQDGNARTVSQIYKNFAKKFDGDDALSTKGAVRYANASSAAKTATRAVFNTAMAGIGSGSSSMSSSGITLASAGSSTINGIKTDTLSTPFAAMMLAQMGLGALDQSSMSSSADELIASTRRRSQIASSSRAAISA